MPENLLADITPARITTLENQVVEARGFADSDELRAHYRAALWRRVGSHGERNGECIRPLWIERDATIPYYPSHYYEWLRMLPLRDVEVYAKNAIKNSRYTHLIEPNLAKSTLKNRFTQGVVGTDVLVRLPNTFAYGERDEIRELTIGARKLAFMLHAFAQGAHAKQGLDLAMLRVVCGSTITFGGGSEYISRALRDAEPEVRLALSAGAYDEAIDCLLGNVNDAIAEWSQTHAFKMIGLED